MVGQESTYSPLSHVMTKFKGYPYVVFYYSKIVSCSAILWNLNMFEEANTSNISSFITIALQLTILEQ